MFQNILGPNAPDIGLCPAKNGVMSDKSYFATDTVVRHELEKSFYKLSTS